MKQKQAAAAIVAVLFTSRDQAHRAHLLTKSYSQHVALKRFYESVVGLADELAEASMGTYGAFSEIPVEPPAATRVIANDLEAHLNKIEDLRAAFGGRVCDKPIESILDTIGVVFATTLYQLRNLS